MKKASVGEKFIVDPIGYPLGECELYFHKDLNALKKSLEDNIYSDDLDGSVYYEVQVTKVFEAKNHALTIEEIKQSKSSGKQTKIVKVKKPYSDVKKKVK